MAILEKTNQQLSLWWNPLGLFVSGLGLLFAIGAIVVGYLLFRQSREYRALIADSIQKYETILNALVQDRLARMQDQVDNLLAESREELRTAKADQRAEIERRIAALEKKREEIRHAELPPLKLSPSFFGSGLASAPSAIEQALGLGSTGSGSLGFSGGLQLSNQVTCSNCGKKVAVPVRGLLDLGPRDVGCPHCGAKITLPY